MHTTKIVFIATLVISLCLATEDFHYWRVPHKDVKSDSLSIRYTVFDEEIADDGSPGFSSEELEEICSKDALCAGFTSDGKILREIEDTVDSQNIEIFVKNTAPMPSAPSVWPLPQTVQSGTQTVNLASNFAFSGNPTFPDLQTLVAWVQSFTFTHKASGSSTGPTMQSISIMVSDQNVPLQLGVDESYKLTIPADGSSAIITAKTLYGAANALQTFSQLVFFNFSTHTYQILGAPYTITDAPRYSHRGILVDTSRHFQPIAILKRVIDSLAFAKFNVFHWHIVDSQSFPFESTSSPKLWDGAYSDYEKYTQDDIKDIIEYARVRNVRVMIEFDTPGHAASWCKGYPQVCPTPTCLQPLNPATEDTFTLLTNLFMECTGNRVGGGLFPDNMIHLGGDEVDTSCWTQTPAISKWLQSQNFTAKDAYLYFVNRVFNIVIGQSRDPVNWQEVYDNFGTKLNKRAIVHAWYNKASVLKAVNDGYRSLNSDGWYLDHLTDLWTAYYANDPAQNVPPEKQNLVLGGETCMWGETVDPSDIFSTIWPRAAAVSERLWSASTVTDTTKALPRYEFFRCLLTTRGIPAAPVHNAQARQPPPQPGSCYAQKK